MQNDWRLTNQMKYLFRARITKAIFEGTATNDHEHCEFCWAKFGEDEGSLKSGYCTLDRYHWICDECFRDFNKQFEWDFSRELDI